MRTHYLLRRLACMFVIVGLLSGILQPIARAQEGATQPEDTSDAYLAAVNEMAAQEGELLFRTLVTVHTTVQWRDLERMNPVFLERGDDWALLLVDHVQLADLARLRYDPQQSNGFNALVGANVASNQAVAASLQPLVTQTQVYASGIGADVTVADAARSSLQAEIHALNADQMAFLVAAQNADADNDGLTDTQETWWCTDAAVADSDFDGVNDGDEVNALKAWVSNINPDNLRSGPPSSGQPFNGWPLDNEGCLDNDRDSIPNLAELYDLGLNMQAESTDRDQFDDGQELFGTTNCPGSGTGCGYGSLPPASSGAGVVLFPEMPGWVKAPGNHPLVAGLPLVEIDIVPDSLHVETVTTITTDKTISEGTEKSYSTAKTEGTSTSVANTETWNEWQEVSVTEPIFATNFVPTTDLNEDAMTQGVLLSILGGAASIVGDTCLVGGIAEIHAGETRTTCEKIYDNRGAIKESLITGGKTATTAIGIDPNVDLLQNTWNISKCALNHLGIGKCLTHGILSGIESYYNDLRSRNNANALGENGSDPGGSGTYIEDPGPPEERDIYAYPRHEIIIPLHRPTPLRTQTNTGGSSRGGAITTTTSEYEEHTVTNGEAFSTVESWGTATAVDSAHAADFRFSYEITNRGQDYARKICEIAFNVYIGDSEVPAITYDVAEDIEGDGCLSNFRPDSAPIPRTTEAIPLSLEQLRAIDTGQPIRVVLSRFVLSTEDFYADDAASKGITIALEDGTDDGDETIDTYIIPTWVSGETVLDVLARYFPHQTDSNGTLVAIWTPEYRSDTPAWCREPKRPTDQPSKALWCKHDLSVADWWNVYTDGLGDGSEGFQDTQAVPGAVALFRFNQDSDHDGFSDRSETQFGTDPDDASSFPFPELLAGVHCGAPNANLVTCTLSLLNTGFYDAYGVEAVMVAPDDSVTINNNTVGGSGRVRAQQQVIVGSRIVPQSPLPSAWTQSGHAVPAAGGYYTGNTDRTYTFTVNCAASGGCSVGSGTWTLGWNDGAGGSGALNFGNGYASPNFLTVGNAGLTLALYSGTVQNGESFTVQALTPRDTFQYKINNNDHRKPLVIVSYNDPQGNHRFLVPPAAMALISPTDNLQTLAGQMLHDVGVELVTSALFAPGNNNLELLVNNPSASTLKDAHLFLELINSGGMVVSEVSKQVDIAPGPTYVPIAFNTNSFDPAYNEDEDYIVMVFFTDYAGNILDTAGRPLSSFQVDPLPQLVADEGTLNWNFGSVAKGTLLKHPLAIANIGFGPLYTYFPPTPGLALDQSGADTIGAADLSSYLLTLRTGDLPQGAYDQSVTIRTSDKTKPTLNLHIQGTITAPSADTAGGLQRPLDVSVSVQGPMNQGESVDFTYNLGSSPESLHPVKVYNEDYSTLLGVGAVATEFGQGTSSDEMFGDGRDGDLTVDGNIDLNPIRASASGTAGNTMLNISNMTGSFQDGQLVLIHQTRGTNAGQWELNNILTVGAGQLTLNKPLINSYISDAGASRAQVIWVPQYHNLTINAGVMVSPAAWNGSIGGIMIALADSTVTINGTLSVNGSSGADAPASSSAIGGGFRGGLNDESAPGIQGEGINGDGTATTGNNGNGGGGGFETANGGNNPGAGGGGGGNGTSGGNGGKGSPGDSVGGTGGSVAGTDDLTTVVFGGGGGGGAASTGDKGGNGGSGGGIIFLIGRNILLSDAGAITTNGGNGGNGNNNAGHGQWGGGAGAGGSVMIRAEDVTLGSSRVTALGGNGGANQGGAGGIGRIRVEYCNTISGSTNPPFNEQKLDCFIAEQVTTGTAQFNLPEDITGEKTYQVQFGRKLDYGGAGEQVSTLRVPTGIANSVILNALISGVGAGDVTFKLDVGNDGTWDWQATPNVTDAATLTSDDLSAIFNSYWQTHGAPATGTLDVPIKVSLSKAGQILLTDLQVNSAGTKLRYVRMPAQAVNSFLLDFTVNGSGSGNQSIALDVGADGSIDWNYSAGGSFPRRLLTADLKDDINAYLAGKSGLVDVPIRFILAPDRTITLNDYRATLNPVLDLAADDPSSGVANIAASPKEGDTIPLLATIRNPSSIDSGPVTVAFFAEAPGWGDWYIGSAFVTNITKGGNANVAINWNTTGFFGEVDVKVIVNPYGRLAETGVGNNVGTSSFSITPADKLSQSINFGSLPTRSLGIAPFTVTPTASSGLPVTLTSLTPAVCTVAGDEVTLISAGTCTLSASQAGNETYAAVTEQASFTVNGSSPLPEQIFMPRVVR